MKIRILHSLIIFLFAGSAWIYAQSGSLSVRVDKDTIYSDEVVKVEFLMENITGNFKAPDFYHFRIISGPNTSSSFSMINGEVTQKKSYNYLLLPDMNGDLEIGSAVLESEDDILQTEPVSIYVFEGKGSSASRNAHDRTFKYELSSPTNDVPKTNTKKRVLKRI